MSANADRRILVVEDDGDVRYLFAELLGRRGFKVETAPDGLAGLDAVERFGPDLVLLNVAMPRMHGYAMMDELRARSLIKRPRVVLMTGGLNNTLQRAHEAGAIDVLYYPVSVEALMQVVDEVLDPAVDERTLMDLSRFRHALRAFDSVGCGAGLIMLQRLSLSLASLNAEQTKTMRAALRSAARERLAGAALTKEIVQERARRYRVIDPAIVALALADAI